MGAEFQTTTLKCKRSELESAFNRLVKEEKHEHGHGGYTGTFAEAPGLDIHEGRIFSSVDEAESYIDAHSKKWENAIAVPVQTFDRAARDAALVGNKPYQKALATWQKAQTKSVALAKEVQAAKNETVLAVKTGKSAFVTCPTCKSKLARAQLQSACCPVCRAGGTISNNLASKSSLAKVERLIVKYQAAAAVTTKAEAALNAIKAAVAAKVATKGGETVWLVGGVFSS